LNLRPSGYEPDELPGCSTPRFQKTEDRDRRGCPRFCCWCFDGVNGFLAASWGSDPCPLSSVVCPLLGRPGGDLLSHVLRRSTIGAEGFHGRVRDGIGWDTLAIATRSSEQRTAFGGRLRAERLDHPCFSRRREAGTSDLCLLSPDHGFVTAHGEVLKPIERLGPVSCTRCRASTSGLSTWWSSTALGEAWF
jgi:hypothetical protein